MNWMPIALAPDHVKEMAEVVAQNYVPPKLRWQFGVPGEGMGIIVFYLGEVKPARVTQYFVLPPVADE